MKPNNEHSRVVCCLPPSYMAACPGIPSQKRYFNLFWAEPPGCLATSACPRKLFMCLLALKGAGDSVFHSAPSQKTCLCRIEMWPLVKGNNGKSDQCATLVPSCHHSGKAWLTPKNLANPTRNTPTLGLQNNLPVRRKPKEEG